MLEQLDKVNGAAFVQSSQCHIRRMPPCRQWWQHGIAHDCSWRCKEGYSS